MMETNGTDPKRIRWTSLALALVTVLVYLRVASHEFVNYDVDLYLIENPHVREGLSWEGVRWAFTSGYAANWHPLTWLSHMLDCQLFGLEPLGHHLTNVALHALATVLLFRFLAGATRQWLPSAAVAALFALHPTHVESVAWIAERKDVLSAVFWMATLCAYLAHAKRPGPGRYLLVALFLVLGLLSKPVVVTLPFVLLLLDHWPLERTRERSWRSLVLEKVPLVALSATASAVTWYVQSGAGAARSFDALGPGERVANAFASYGVYLRQSVWPAGLGCFYPHAAFLPGDLTRSLYLPAGVGALVVLGLSALFLLRRTRSPYGIVGWLWYLGTLVPVIGLVQVGHQAHADRYTYLPTIGLYLIGAFGLAQIVSVRRHLAQPVLICASVVLLVFTALTWRQIGFWRDSLTLHQRALDVTQDNFLAHYHVGLTLARAGALEEARPELERALEIRPSYFLAHQALAEIFERQGNLARAEEHAAELLRFQPRDPAAFLRLARVLGLRGRTNDAAELYRRLLRLDPGQAEAHLGLGLLAAGAGDFSAAEVHFRAALDARPGYAEAHLNLGVLYANQGRTEAAEEELRAALISDPGLDAARENLRLLEGG